MKNNMPSLIEPEVKEKELDNIMTGYAQILESLGLEYEEAGYYLQVGRFPKTQGWILHISMAYFEVIQVLRNVIPILVKESVTFKIPKNLEISSKLLSGQLGYHLFGKIITIYPESDMKALSLAKLLIPMSTSYKGMQIPTDFRLGGCIHTRFGAFDPVIKIAPDGVVEKYIYNRNGELVKDVYTIPFSMSKDLEWPFEEIKPLNNRRPKKILNRSYLCMEQIKSDLKGAVIKALNIKKWYNIHYCILKQGKQNVCADHHGRDMTDRLKWQFEVHKILENKVSMPKAIDYFEKDGDGFLVTQFIEGTKLNSYIVDTYDQGNWLSFTIAKKLEIIEYLQKIISVVESLHNCGYIHRDLTPSNFILDKKRKVYLIDFELCYDIKQKIPLPPFGMGTPGFMPPEQLSEEMPTIKEDIYALGALMVYFFTGMFPSNMNILNDTLLLEQLNFFIQNAKVVNLISSCLSIDPNDRPLINLLRDAISEISFEITSTNIQKYSSLNNHVDRNKCTIIIDKGLSTLKSSIMLHDDGIWVSKPPAEERMVLNEVNLLSKAFGLGRGIGGVLYLISNAVKAGYNIDKLSNTISINWSLFYNYFINASDLNPGLYNGAAGLASVISKCISSNIINPSDEILSKLKLDLLLPNEELNIETGLAGQGIAILQSIAYIGDKPAKEMSNYCATIILNAQQPDGSWIFENKAFPDQRQKFYGFSNGVSGIVWFLLEYYDKYKDDSIKLAAIKALQWLNKSAIRQKGGTDLFWSIRPGSDYINPWIDFGYSGVILCFIKAYEKLGDISYKEIAVAALKTHPTDVTSIYLNFASGLAGIGELMLEAYKVFGDTEWKERADWIANLLLHTYTENDDGSLFWYTEIETLVTPDLMLGNAGILNFLIRYNHFDSIPFIFSIY